MIFMVVRVVKNNDGKALFILIGYLSQILPWIAVSRIVFIYHYFPSTLFLILALAHIFNTIIERRQGRYKQAIYGFTAAAGALFVVFYPALTGVLMPQWYFNYLIRWIPDFWPF
jgi:dolichyl-phosphate-mannose--protein O-mannosyl transferase